MKPQNIDRLKSIIEDYESVIRGMEERARSSSARAYGGIIRAEKGKLVERIGKKLIEIGWEALGMERERLSFAQRSIRIPLKKEYVEKVRNSEVREYIREHIHRFYYPLKPDVQIYIDGEFAIAMECKAYTENAMLKRILVDFTLLKHIYPNLSFVLLQLESQLGGDYSSPTSTKYGSPSTHTLLSYFDIDLDIITLLPGERKVDQPIHKLQYYKPLERENLEGTLKVIQDILRRKAER